MKTRPRPVGIPIRGARPEKVSATSTGSAGARTRGRWPATRTTIETRTRPKPERSRRLVPSVVFVVVLVAAVWGIPKLLRNDRARRVSSPPTRRPNQAPPPGTGEAAHPLGTPAPVPAGTGKFEVVARPAGQRRRPRRVGSVPPDPLRRQSRRRPRRRARADQGRDRKGGQGNRAALRRRRPDPEKASKDRKPYQPTQYDGRRWAPVLIAWSDEASYRRSPATSPASATRKPSTRARTSSCTSPARSCSTTNSSRSRAARPRRRPRGHPARARAPRRPRPHVAIARSSCSPKRSSTSTRLRRGDLRGLALLGTQACFPSV